MIYIMPRCFSKCRGVSESECKPPCSFVAKKYCRLSSKLKMKGEDCLLVKKNKTSKLNNSVQKIQRFIKKTEGKRKSRFLQEICSDSGICLAFGKERKRLMDFFQFSQFTYAKFPTKTIGVSSSNGFVKEIRYERENYQAYAVLKSAKHAKSDNLAYEYMVGKFLNEKAKKFPVFIETYGLFTYKDSLERDEHLTKNELKSRLSVLDPMDIVNVFRKKSTQCILIQHLKGVKTLNDMALSMSFFVYESPYLLYHLFFALKQMRKEFTHYDLHTDNVLVYEPVKGSHLEYHYHLPNQTLVFQSKYIVKMIDYGRCFFPGAPAYYDKVTYEQGGIPKPFGYLRKSRTEDDYYYFVNPYYKNESHDLKVLKEYSKKIDMSGYKKGRMLAYIDLLKNVVYENVKYPEKSRFGTKEDVTHDDKIRNVTDVEHRLRYWILDKENISANQKQFKASNKLGEFHIYSDGKDMEYKPI
jgi:hypothetical protein